MSDKPEDFLMQAWKQQLDAGLRVIETIVESATKLREMQIKAATEAHADLEATRKAIASSADPARLFELQAQWMRSNAEKSAAYWRELYAIMAGTHGEVLGRLCAPLPPAARPADASKDALLGVIDNAYRQWLDATQQFYKLPAIPETAKPERRAAA